MSTPSENPARPLTATQLETWLITMNQKRFALYARTKDPHAHAVIFWEAADLLSEAIEEIRVISAALREDSAALRGRVTGLLEHSTELLERHPHRLKPNA